MSDAVSIAVRCIAIAEDIVRPVLETMRREQWPDEFRGIVLIAITRRFQEEADKAFLAHRKQILTDGKSRPETTANSENIG